MADVSGSNFVPLPTGDDAWRAAVTPEQSHGAPSKGAHKPFSGVLTEAVRPGVYRCVCCGEPLFDSDAKFLSSSGWPNFSQPIASEAVKTSEDYSLCLPRIEILCAKCDAHLGHLFDDGPKPSGLRYCVNAEALRFEESQDKPSESLQAK